MTDGVNVNPSTGFGLAQAYASKVYKDEIVCDEKNIRKASLDAFLQCHSKDKSNRRYYEFQFDDLNESWKNDIFGNDVLQKNAALGYCKLYGGDWHAPANVHMIYNQTIR